MNKPNALTKCIIELLHHLTLLGIQLIKFVSSGERLENQENVYATRSDTPNNILPLFSKLESQSSPSIQKEAMARKRSRLFSPQHGTQCKIAFPVVAKDS